MRTRSFGDLVTDVRQRRIVGDTPPVLLLGAGASVAAGIGAMPEIYKLFGCSDFEGFSQIIDGYSPEERYRTLYQFLQTRDPSQVSRGYKALAALCANAYFDLVLTTNFDPLMDDALAAAKLWRKDYLLLVNSVIRKDWLTRFLPERQPRVKVIKLHGDLFHRTMAWTVKEMDAYLEEISPALAPTLANRDVLVVGQSLRDRRIRELVMDNARTIWFTHPERAPDHLEEDERLRVVVSPECTFERLFEELARRLEVAFEEPQALKTDDRRLIDLTIQERGGFLGVERSAGPVPELADNEKLSLPVAVEISALSTASALPPASTIDDFMASVVAIEGPSGEKMCTGFVLAEPRVIVTDGFPVRSLGPTGRVTVVTSDGKRHHDAILHRDESHPFGVVSIEAFENVKRFPGLRLGGPPKAGSAVHIGVAAGERTGVSSGHIRDPRERTIDVQPVGRVSQLIEVDCRVAQGSSGAPVVDDELRVLGYVVAGGEKPPAFMYPATRWAPRLKALQSGPLSAPGTTPTEPKRTRRTTRRGTVG